MIRALIDFTLFVTMMLISLAILTGSSTSVAIPGSFMALAVAFFAAYKGLVRLYGEPTDSGN